MYHKLQQNPLSSDIAKSINIYDINIYDIKLVVFFYIILFSYPHKMEYWMPPLVLVKKSPHPHWPIFQHISTRICLKKPTKVNSNSPEKFWDFTELKYGHCGYCHHCHRAASFQRLSHCIPMISLIKSSPSKNKTSRNYLVGGFNPPSEKWWSSSVGMMTFPTEWKVIKKLFQTTNQLSMPVPITLNDQFWMWNPTVQASARTLVAGPGEETWWISSKVGGFQDETMKKLVLGIDLNQKMDFVAVNGCFYG
jgi:hypothetical protein